ncbi:MAG: hypothetical protein OEW19_02580 [Acidobacteriota bacterium]|nr:hypothetical protein [Acidobacteriota bacterium]
MSRSMTAAAVCAVMAAVLVTACSGGDGGSSSTPSSPSPSPTAAATITIGADGRVSPSTVTVAPGSRVSFVNNHNQNHDMSSDPHPDHTDCPEINQVGFLTPGQTRTTGNLTTVRTCGFHDHNQPTNNDLRGSIVIQ